MEVYNGYFIRISEIKDFTKGNWQHQRQKRQKYDGSSKKSEAIDFHLEQKKGPRMRFWISLLMLYLTMSPKRILLRFHMLG